jgi:hypothetical protein
VGTVVPGTARRPRIGGMVRRRTDAVPALALGCHRTARTLPDRPTGCVRVRARWTTDDRNPDRHAVRKIWMWMLYDTEKRASILQWWDPIIGSSLWQELRAGEQGRAPSLTKREWYILYRYLWPQHLSEMVQETRRLRSSEAPDDRYAALTVLTRWLESPDHETRTVAAQMLHGWTHVVAAIVRAHPSDTVIRDTLVRMVPTILTATPRSITPHGSPPCGSW